MKTLTLITLCITVLLSAGCQSVFTNIVTITEIRHSVMNDLGEELRAGRLSAETWQKVVQIDQRYLEAARTARVALETYRDLGTGDPVMSLNAVRAIVFELITLLSSYQDVEIETIQLANSTKL